MLRRIEAGADDSSAGGEHRVSRVSAGIRLARELPAEKRGEMENGTMNWVELVAASLDLHVRGRRAGQFGGR